MDSVIDTLIEEENFHHYAQGLFHTTDQTKVGIELLLRSNLGNPDFIFGEAKRVNRLYELETKSIIKLLNTYTSKKSKIVDHLFINLYPSTILHPNFPDFIRKVSNQFPQTANRITFEVIESEKVDNIPLLKENIQLMKSLNYWIAIDDVGKGWSSLNIIIEIEPHYIKLDHYFSINLSKSALKQKMIESLLDYAQFSNAKVVLEGVEQENDLSIAKELGIPLCQGYFLEKPQPLSL